VALRLRGVLSSAWAAFRLPGPLGPRLWSVAGVLLPLPLVFAAGRLSRRASGLRLWLRLLLLRRRAAVVFFVRPRCRLCRRRLSRLFRVVRRFLSPPSWRLAGRLAALPGLRWLLAPPRRPFCGLFGGGALFVAPSRLVWLLWLASDLAVVALVVAALAVALLSSGVGPAGVL